MNNIEALQIETIRLIGLQKRLLLNIKDEIPASAIEFGGDEADHEATGQFTPEAINSKIKALEENLIKTSNLDMVLAVVGAMKAGKSTCINAIVGQEILPNRNRPMTALPTLIRHKPGVATPVLHFGESKQGPVLALVQQMQKLLAKKDYPGREHIKGDADLLALSDVIAARAGPKSGYKLKARYEGAEGIFAFLKGLNDLVRLAKELGLRFPFEHYTSITDFPEIEVEFFHLKQTGQDGQGGMRGNFALLDTPGFNEAGQAEYLLPMLKEQLEKATAVLAVLDYTQLKSESEATLREALEEITAFSGDRMFCLVNRFDERNSNSDDEDATRTYVARNLLDKVFGPKVDVARRIFPVSGQQAYLAKRAELEIERCGSLGWQEGQPASWVDTFGKEALGTSYHKRINDRDEIVEGYRDLWELSQFDAPLTNVVQYSRNNAARMAIQAATAKLGEIAGGQDGDTARGIGAMLDLRLQGLDVDAEQIKRLVADLNKQLKTLKSRKDKAGKKLDELVKDVDRSMEKSLQEASKKVNSAIKAAFDKNAKQQAAELPAKGNRLKSKDNVPVCEVRDVMEFDSLSEAQDYLKEIDDKFTNYLKGSTDALNKDLHKAVEAFRVELRTLHSDIQDNIREFEKHAAKAGLDGMKISAPDLSRPKNAVNAGRGGGHLVKNTSYERTGSRNQDGVVAAGKRVLGFIFRQDWGKDEYKENVERYTFTKIELENYYSKMFKAFNAELASTVKITFTTPMQANKEEFFAGISDAFDSIRESLNVSRENQQESSERQAEIRATLQKLKLNFDDSVEEIRELARNAKKLATA